MAKALLPTPRCPGARVLLQTTPSDRLRRGARFSLDRPVHPCCRHHLQVQQPPLRHLQRRAWNRPMLGNHHRFVKRILARPFFIGTITCMSQKIWQYLQSQKS
eukprot:1258001-Pyramimonas_sp.AAC.1